MHTLCIQYAHTHTHTHKYMYLYMRMYVHIIIRTLLLKTQCYTETKYMAIFVKRIF